MYSNYNQPYAGLRPPASNRPAAPTNQGAAQVINPIQAAMLQLGGLGGGGVAPGFPQFGIVPLQQLQGYQGMQGVQNVQAIPLQSLAGLTFVNGSLQGNSGGGFATAAAPSGAGGVYAQQPQLQYQPYQQRQQVWPPPGPRPRVLPPPVSMAPPPRGPRPPQHPQPVVPFSQGGPNQGPSPGRSGGASRGGRGGAVGISSRGGGQQQGRSARGGGRGARGSSSAGGGRFGSPGHGPPSFPGRRGGGPAAFAGRGGRGGFVSPPAGPPPVTQPVNGLSDGASLSGVPAVVAASPQPPLGRKKREALEASLPFVPSTAAPAAPRVLSVAEKADAARWIEERRANFPTGANVAARAAEAEQRAATGELSAQTDRRRRLREVLAQQQAMGLDRQAGTSDLIREMNGGGGGGGRGGRFDGGGRGRGRGGMDRGRGGRMNSFTGSARGGFQGGGRGWGRGGPLDGFQQPQGPALGDKRPAEAAADGEEGAKRARAGNGGMAPAEVGSLGHLQGYGSSGDEAGKQGGAAEAGAQPAAAGQEARSQGRGYGGRGRGRGGRFGDSPGRGRLGDVQGRGRFGRGTGAEGRGQGRGARGRGRGEGGFVQPARPRPPTLLQKLLAKDVRRGRSHLLQAFRFMVANTFLQDVGPLVFPSELGLSSGTAKPALPPVEEIFDVEDSDDEGMGAGAGAGKELAEGMDPAPCQDASAAVAGGGDVVGATDKAADSADVFMVAAPQ